MHVPFVIVLLTGWEPFGKNIPIEYTNCVSKSVGQGRARTAGKKANDAIAVSDNSADYIADGARKNGAGLDRKNAWVWDEDK